MFDDLKPDDIPAPPSRALEEAVRRGTGIRRRRRAAWASGAVAVVLLVVAVVLGGPFNGNDTATVVPATTAPVTPKNYSPIPDKPTEEKDGVSFGYLQKATQNPDGSLTLLIQPGYFLIGDAAAAANGGEVPLDDYLTDAKKGTVPINFRLDPKATLVGLQSLLGHINKSPTNGTRITTAQLLKNVQKADDPNIFIWFRQADDGSITAIREQFTP